jgi:ComF family protein
MIKSMNYRLFSLLRTIRAIIFPLPERKHNLPQTYQDFIEELSPQTQTYEGITYFFRYKTPAVKEFIEELKRYNNRRYFSFAGRVIADTLSHQSSHHPILLIPLPQTARRLRERGYDVTQSLVFHILKNLPDEPFLDGSRILKHNRSYHQSGIKNRQERLNSSRGMFKILSQNSNLSLGFHYILIDDVCTTGASMREAERILKEAGGIIVKKITLAHS